MRQSTIAAIFNSEKTKILAIKRRDVPVWVLPGGALEPDENPEEGIVREVVEETGLDVTINRKVALYTPINKLGTTTHFFECSINAGKPTVGDETADIGFFSIDKLPKHFFYIHEQMLSDITVTSESPIEKKFDQVTYWALFRYFLRHPILVIRFALSQAGLPINKKP